MDNNSVLFLQYADGSRLSHAVPKNSMPHAAPSNRKISSWGGGFPLICVGDLATSSLLDCLVLLQATLLCRCPVYSH